MANVPVDDSVLIDKHSPSTPPEFVNEHSSLVQTENISERSSLLPLANPKRTMRETFFTFSHKIIRYFILMQSYMIFSKISFGKVCDVIIILFCLFFYVLSLLTVLFYSMFIGYAAIASCPNSSNNSNLIQKSLFDDPDHLSIVIPVFSLYTALGYVISYCFYQNIRFIAEICQPLFIQSNESIKSNILTSHFHYVFFYIFALLLVSISLILFVTMSQLIEIYPDRYISCTDSTGYKIVDSIKYIAPFFVFGAIFLYSTPLNLSLSIYFILNTTHDDVFSAIDESKQYILQKGIPNVGDILFKSPLKVYYELLELIIAKEDACSILKTLTFLSMLQSIILFFSTIFHLKNLYFDRNYIVACWLLLIYIYHFTTMMLLVIKNFNLNKTLHSFADTILKNKLIRESLLGETPGNKEFSSLMKKELQIISSSRVSVRLFSLGNLSDVSIKDFWMSLIKSITTMIVPYVVYVIYR